MCQLLNYWPYHLKTVEKSNHKCHVSKSCKVKGQGECTYVAKGSRAVCGPAVTLSPLSAKSDHPPYADYT